MCVRACVRYGEVRSVFIGVDECVECVLGGGVLQKARVEQIKTHRRK